MRIAEFCIRSARPEFSIKTSRTRAGTPDRLGIGMTFAAKVFSVIN